MEIWTNALYMFMLTFGQRVAIYRMGYGTAVAVTMLLMVIVFSGIVRLLMRREKIEF
jgi:ABC-type sugar transport system permease subunit